MSEDNDGRSLADGAGRKVDPYKVERAHKRLDDHEQTHQQFDRRISMNENYRLQVQGALKVITFILGTAILGYIVDFLGFI
jgi:hypothetical protein